MVDIFPVSVEEVFSVTCNNFDMKIQMLQLFEQTAGNTQVPGIATGHDQLFELLGLRYFFL